MLLVLLFSTGCGFKKSIEDKMAEEITEGVLEKVAGDDADIELDDGNISIKGEDGSELTIGSEAIGSEEWPKGKVIDLIPEFKHGTIASSMNSDTACVITLEDVEQKAFDSYLEEVKSIGYTKDGIDSSSDIVISYYAISEKDNSQITLSYTIENKDMMLSITLEE